LNNKKPFVEHMINPASFVLAGFQDTLVSAFGPSLGWIIGQLILIFLLISIIWIIQNRNHIVNESGWGYSNLLDISVILILTGAQHIIYTNLLEFPVVSSLGISLFVTMSLRWHILVLE